MPSLPVLVEELPRDPAGHVATGYRSRGAAAVAGPWAEEEADREPVPHLPGLVGSGGVQDPAVVPGDVAELQIVVLEPPCRREVREVPAPE
eukprot:CAMPEP_0195139526 /NCGR_PEP_ID=MMETSP0448-20130528/159586_1 /TAXON_ID=66468 /ORGANISM="Heterocapsa triquestra, Strain CCMP 448" /LENGTH=90 /DNA_ID=CAMNT_0040177841 /DNA_START=35 /DNA_END=307 /DNA_ORIENTATION=-